MSIQSDLFDTLKALVSNRVYPDTFVQPSGNLPNWPAIRYVIVGGESFPSLCGDADIETDSPRVQLDVVAKTATARDTLKDQVIEAMKTFDPPATRQSPAFSEYDADTKTFRATLDYVIQGSSTS